jgi:MarR family transcriptional regulator, protease production regulatory protein HPr
MDLLQKQNLLLIVRALYFCLEEQWAKMGKMFNITPAQQHILFLLSTNNRSLTPTLISELGCWHISTVTRLLQPLLEKGFITITVDPVKPKYKKVTITNEGLSMLARIVDSVKNNDSFPIDLTHLPESDLAQFLTLGKNILDLQKGEDFKVNVLDARMEGMDYA